VIIDDAQWLDQASMAVLAFAARRGVAGSVSTGRSARDTLSSSAAAYQHTWSGPISNDAAGTLLDSYFPTIAPRVRRG